MAYDLRFPFDCQPTERQADKRSPAQGANSGTNVPHTVIGNLTINWNHLPWQAAGREASQIRYSIICGATLHLQSDSSARGTAASARKPTQLNIQINPFKQRESLQVSKSVRRCLWRLPCALDNAHKGEMDNGGKPNASHINKSQRRKSTFSCERG